LAAGGGALGDAPGERQDQGLLHAGSAGDVS
jgi:hypothetical protein